MTVLLVAAGGAVGAVTRYLVDVWVQARHGTGLPWGIFVVNAVGSLLAGVVMGAAAAGRLPEAVVTLAGTGFCGALTTYSTLALDTVTLARTGRRAWAVLNALGSVTVGLAACALGWLLGSA